MNDNTQLDVIAGSRVLNVAGVGRYLVHRRKGTGRYEVLLNSRPKYLLALAIFMLLFSSKDAAAQNYDIIVAFGQSNATQAGQGSYNDPLQSSTIDNKIKTLRRFGDNPGEIIPAFFPDGNEHLESWLPMKKKDYDVRHAFIISFARNYVKYEIAPERKVLILPAARDGTSVLEWNRNLVVYPESPLLYTDMIGKVDQLLSIPGNKLVSLNMSLGETDITYAELGWHGMTPQLYGKKMRELLGKLKTRYPGVPIITTKFAYAFRPGSTLKLQFEQELVLATNSVGGKTVNTNGLGSFYDNTHFTAQAMHTLGVRHWDSWVLLAP